MAYHGYLRFISEYSTVINKVQNKTVKILEIGVDTGITLFALNNNLNLLNVPFEYTGLDIKVQRHISVLNYTFLQKFESNKIKVYEENSLNYLKDCNEIFDVILIDGDHNYKTVKKELSYLDMISHENTLVICDDYKGRWATLDLYYANRDGYEDNTKATKFEESEKQGVMTAIDEFLYENKNFTSFTLMEGEPICIINKKNNIIKKETTDD